MQETTSATYSGVRDGLTDAAVLSTADSQALLSATRPYTAPSLNPDLPFGITFIIGGTNVRVCVSYPSSDTPSIKAWKWQELQNELQETLSKSGSSFEHAKEIVFRSLAGKFVDFLDSHFPGLPGGAPLDKLCAFNFSVAGVVSGEGRDAEVSTSNTGVIMKEERIAVSMLDAINAELRDRKALDTTGSRCSDSIKSDSVAVMNDAAAGLMGERISGGLKGVKNGLFIIVGTGLGSFGLVDEKLAAWLSELGHTMRRLENKEDYELVASTDLGSMMSPGGGFAPLSTDAPYAENEIAGPWAASKFAKRIKENHRVLYPLLYSAVCKILETKAAAENREARPRDEIKRDLDRIVDLNYSAMEKWAVSAPSDVLTALNQLLFSHQATEVADSVECSGVNGTIERATHAKDIAAHHREEAKRHLETSRIYEEQSKALVPDSPLQLQMLLEKKRWEDEATRLDELATRYEKLHEDGLTKAFEHLRWIEFQAYVKELAKFLKASYKAMEKKGCAPEKIVIAGGIGELLHRLTSEARDGDSSVSIEDRVASRLLKRKIEWLLRANAVDIPQGVVEFSSMSPEAREAAVTTQQVMDAFLVHLKSVSKPDLQGFKSTLVM